MLWCKPVLRIFTHGFPCCCPPFGSICPTDFKWWMWHLLGQVVNGYWSSPVVILMSIIGCRFKIYTVSPLSSLPIEEDNLLYPSAHLTIPKTFDVQIGFSAKFNIQLMPSYIAYWAIIYLRSSRICRWMLSCIMSTLGCGVWDNLCFNLSCGKRTFASNHHYFW